MLCPFSSATSFIHKPSVSVPVIFEITSFIPPINMGKVFFGKIVHSKSFNELEVIANGYLAVKDGKVSHWEVILSCLPILNNIRWSRQ